MDSKLKEQDENETSTEQTYLTYEVGIGYEFHKDLNRVQLVYGLEVGYGKQRFQENYTYNSDNTDYTASTVRDYRIVSVAPLLGVKYFITPSFSIGTEMRFKVEDFIGSNTFSNSQNDRKDVEEISGLRTKLGPLGQLSVNVHF
jgi:hypothetical protein